MEALLIKYGYVLFFLGVAAEGDAFLLGGAFLAYRGVFQLPLVIILAITSNTLVGLIYYMVSRTRGRAWLENRFSSFRTFAPLLRWMERHSERLLLASRYAVGFRIIIPAACGALGMPPARFNILNLLGSILWVVPTALLAFYFSDAAERLFVGVKRYELWILLFLVVIAGLILLFRHLHRTEWFEDLKIEDLHYLAPLLIGFMGAVNVISAIWPRSHGHLGAIGQWLSLAITQPSRPLMLVAGVALIQVSRSLTRRKTIAWYFAITALSASLLLHVTRDFDLQNALAAGLLLAYLIPNRRRFSEPADPGSLRLAVMMACLLAIAVFIYGFIGLWHLEEQFDWHTGSGLVRETFRAGILILEPRLEPKTAGAAYFLISLEIAGWLARIYLLVLILPPVFLRHHKPPRRLSI